MRVVSGALKWPEEYITTSQSVPLTVGTKKEPETPSLSSHKVHCSYMAIITYVMFYN